MQSVQRSVRELTIQIQDERGVQDEPVCHPSATSELYPSQSTRYWNPQPQWWMARTHHTM